MAKPVIYLRERIYIPEKIIDGDEYLDDLVKDLFNETACDKCNYLAERPCEVCESCDNYQGRFKFYREITAKGVDYVGIPYGARTMLPLLVSDYRDYEVLDKRPLPPMKYADQIKFTGELRDYQVDAVAGVRKGLKKKRSGVLQSPPRSGKTVMGTALACLFKTRTLIIAKQRDYLENFYETIVGSASQPAMTNIRELEEETGDVICKFAEKEEDFYEADIVLCTVQTFFSVIGKAKLQNVKNIFGFILGDEIHQFAAKESARCLSAFNAQYLLGLTATPRRKDGRDIVIQHVLGSVLYEVNVKNMDFRVVFHETKCVHNRADQSWTYYLKWLEKQKTRNDMLIKNILADVKAGHSCVVPAYGIRYMTQLVKDINDAYGENIAALFTGQQSKTRRKALIEKARAGRILVTVGTRKIVSTGINVPIWSSLHECMPISNAPNFEQQVNRIRTPMEGKKMPVVHMYLDVSSIGRGCLRTCLFAKKEASGGEGLVEMGAKITPEQWGIANKYLRKGTITFAPEAHHKDATGRRRL